MARSDDLWLHDIICAIADIRSDTSGMDYAGFAANPTVTRSVLYSIAVMGEPAKNISPEFKDRYPKIPWRAIAGTGDKIVHEYFRTNTRRIWDVVASDIDEIERALRHP
jgi:uncharacterized protein with HEPN domain